MRFVEVKGKDAAEFLHRVTAGTVRGINVMEGREGLLLTGRSLVRAQFDLLRVEEQRFLLATPGPCARELAEGLEELHFSESLEIRLATDILGGIRLCSGASREAGKNFPVYSQGAELSWNTLVPGYGVATGAAAETEDGEIYPRSWEYDRIAALLPKTADWLSTQAPPGVPALEAGFLPWIDRFKGCYPGQEVVELSLNVGHPARVLISVASPQPLKGSVNWNGAEAQVTSSATLDGKHAALVRVPWKQKDFLPGGFTLLKSH